MRLNILGFFIVLLEVEANADGCDGVIGCFPEKYRRVFGGVPIRKKPLSRFNLGGKSGGVIFNATWIEPDSSFSYLSNRSSTDDVFKKLKAKNKMVVIIHGWQIANTPVKEMINGRMTETVQLGTWQNDLEKVLFEKHDDVNVVIVDWRAGATVGYRGAMANTWIVARETVVFLKAFINRGLALEDIHVLGHSLGAHIAGIIGNNLKLEFGKKIGRVSGLDPAAPSYDEVPGALMIDTHNAELVDVYHTDTKSRLWSNAGLPGQHGHADFYVNGGEDQPRCKKLKTISKQELCDHFSVVDYFVQSVKSPTYAIRCGSFEEFIAGKCKSCGRRKCAVAGYNYQPFGNHKDGKLFYQTTEETKDKCAKSTVFEFKTFGAPESFAKQNNVSLELKLVSNESKTRIIKDSSLLPTIFNSRRKTFSLVRPIPCGADIFPLERIEILLGDVQSARISFPIRQIKIFTIEPRPYRAKFKRVSRKKNVPIVFRRPTDK